MNLIISPKQCSFVLSRGTYIIIVVQEVIRSMRQMKGKKGIIAIKIDLEKAYGIIKWNFMMENLKKKIKTLVKQSKL